MRTLDKNAVAAFAERINRIGPESNRQWGTLTPESLMPHLRCMIELSLEEQSLPDFPVPFSKTALFRWGMLYLPWPRGAKSPETIFPPAGSALDEEREKLIAAMHRFAEAYAHDPRRKTRSPLLGLITLHDWARLHAKHLAHHLKQFGC